MLKIKNMNSNNVIRQGDSRPREYQLDTGNLELNLTNKSATIRLMTADFQGIGYETTATVSSENKISFSIDDIIPAREYRLEITVDDYVFPSRATDGRFDIDPSSHGQELNIIQVIGKEEIVRDVKARVENELEPFLGDIEQAELDRQAQEEARVGAESARDLNEQTRLNKDLLRDDKIAQMEADKDAVIANATVDSEVILARGGFSVLGDRLDNIDRELSHSPIMGAEWDRSPSPTMTRIGASKGLVANIGIGNQVVQNDFDTMPIYREMQRETDNYGNVFVRVPKFYIRKTVTDELYRVEISKERLKDFYLPAVFYDFENGKELDYFLYGAYIASSADGTKIESKAGVKPLVSRNIVQFRDYATANGLGYQQLDIHAVDVLQALFRVEFATLNSQSLHPGFTHPSNTESAFTGGVDELTATSGAMGISGSHQFVYRGIEDPWGNVYQFVDGVNINDHQVWVCRDARQYASNVFASPYEKLGYVNATENTWVTKIGYDSNNPFAEFPISGGGATTTHYADHYYQNAGQRIAPFGGHWSNGAPAGLSLWSLNHSSANAYSTFGGRLVRKPL